VIFGSLYLNHINVDAAHIIARLHCKDSIPVYCFALLNYRGFIFFVCTVATDN